MKGRNNKILNKVNENLTLKKTKTKGGYPK